MNYYLYRNGKPYGPYSPSDFSAMVQSGKVLKCDTIAETDTAVREEEFSTVAEILRQHNLPISVSSAGNIFAQLKHIGSDLILPKQLLQKETWTRDYRLLLMTIIGMFPLVAAYIVPSEFLTFYAISLYFASVWGLFFYYFFKTSQVKLRTAITIFVLTQALLLMMVGGILQAFNPFYKLNAEGPFLSRLSFFVCGVGFTEELVKMAPLIIILARAKQPLIPRTLVFYGLVSGLAFGVAEGVQYQMQINSQADYATAYYLNIARMTTLPFNHAIWAAIAGFFLSFAHLYPRYRKALYLLALTIPAIIHGTYDTFASMGDSLLLFVAFPICILAVGLLNHYLDDAAVYRDKLK